MILGHLALVAAALFTSAAFYVNFAEQLARLALRLLAGALAIVAPWPWTLLVIKPVNHRLNATPPARAGSESRALIERWGRLHAGRTALGVLATAIFFWSTVS